MAMLLLVVAGGATSVEARQSRSAGEGLTLAVIGDFGSYDANEEAVAELVKGWQPDAVITVGDNIQTKAVGGTGTDRYDRAVGRYYCRFLHAVAPGEWCDGGKAEANRFWPATGNHDYSDGGIENYLAYFSLPGNERYYDVVLGPVHVFFIDSQKARRSERSLQSAWLKGALGASASPWKVVVLHHPPYSSGAAHGSTPAVQWPYNAWGADLVLSGHDHSYERLAAEGIPYVVNGLGGYTRRGFGTIDPGSVTRFNASWGAMRIDASAQTLEARFVSVDGTSEDTFSVARPARRPGAFSKVLPVDAASTAATSVRLRWPAAKRAYSYEYCVDTVIDGRCSTTWRNAGTRTRARVTQLAAGKVHEWQVRALNSAGGRIADRGAWWRFKVPE
jgi:tartrate-resistant acid phosphatase type 5